MIHTGCRLEGLSDAMEDSNRWRKHVKNVPQAQPEDDAD